MSDQEAQENELLALSSIYDDTVFIAAEDGSGGQFCSIIDLPDNFQINAPAPPDEEKERETTKEVGDPRAIQDLASPSLLVPALVEYDQERRQHMFNTTMYNCNVCFGEKLGADCIGFKGCDHVYVVGR